jgi:hypothetical protein
MPSQTEFAKLSLYNGTTDKTEKFGSFRDALAGTGSDSNMNKIDILLKQHNTSLTEHSTSIGDIQQSIQNINAKDNTQDESIAAINSSVAEIKAKDEAQDSAITTINSNISTINSEITAVKAKNTEQDASITNINSSISSLQRKNTEQDAEISKKAVTATYTADIGTEWTGDVAPYTQTVAVTGITANDNPIVDICSDSANDTFKLELKAYSLVSKIATGENSITLTCLDKKPVTAFALQLKVVK